jgi:hypothetical protein
MGNGCVPNCSHPKGVAVGDGGAGQYLRTGAFTKKTVLASLSRLGWIAWRSGLEEDPSVRHTPDTSLVVTPRKVQ